MDGANPGALLINYLTLGEKKRSFLFHEVLCLSVPKKKKKKSSTRCVALGKYNQQMPSHLAHQRVPSDVSHQ